MLYVEKQIVKSEISRLSLRKDWFYMGNFVTFENVSKIYDMGEVKIPALSDASFEIGKGE